MGAIMGVVAILIALAAPVEAQLPEPAQSQAQQPRDETAHPQVPGPEPYRLPAPAPAGPVAAQDVAYPNDIALPPMAPDPFTLPLFDYWHGNEPIRMQAVGVKFGWQL